jgi:predicted nucleic acid-binding protein
MATYYLDSSALCKRYVAEAGAGWIVSLFDPAQRHRLLVVRVTHVEIASALARRAREGTLSTSGQSIALRLLAYHLSRRLGVVEVDAALCEQAATLANRQSLRAYDSLQLAGAIKANTLLTSVGAGSLTFLSADVRLLKAAEAEGLSVDNPENH